VRRLSALRAGLPGGRTCARHGPGLGPRVFAPPLNRGGGYPAAALGDRKLAAAAPGGPARPCTSSMVPWRRPLAALRGLRRPSTASALSKKSPRPRPFTALGAKWVKKDCQNRPKFPRLRRARGGRWLKGGGGRSWAGGAPGRWGTARDQRGPGRPPAALRVYITRIERGRRRPQAALSAVRLVINAAPDGPLPHRGGSIRPRGGPRPANPLSTGGPRVAVTRPSPLGKKKKSVSPPFKVQAAAWSRDGRPEGRSKLPTLR
jgi:hypothetical protein